MSQEEFLINMVTRGNVTVKANELRELLQSHQELKNTNDSFKIRLEKATSRIYKLRAKIEMMKISEPIHIDLKG